MRPLLIALLFASLAACDGEIGHPGQGDAGGGDTGSTGGDAGAGPDAPAEDAGPADAGLADAGPTDTGSGEDAGPTARPIGPRPVLPTPVAAGTIFAAPDGSGTACTEAAPCDVWEATAQAQAGDVVFLRGGAYVIDRNLTFEGRGTAPSPPVFESYPGEVAVLDGAPSTASDEFYIRVVGDPVVLRLLEVRNMPRMGIAVRSSDNVLEGLHVHHNLLSGIHVHESYDVPLSNRNLIRDCEVHDNSGAGLSDPEFADGGNSDGISMSSGLGNRVENCLVYANSDDGIDTWRTEDSYVGYSIVYGNGIAAGNGQGVKAGGAAPSRGTFVEHCLAYSNRAAGFDQNSGLEVVFAYNTSWDNERGYWSGADTVLEHNLAAETNAVGGGGISTDNSWQRTGAVAFVSVDPTSPGFLVPVPGGGFEDLGAYANRE